MEREAQDGRRYGNELGGVEEEEPIIRIYYVRKIAIFNKRKIRLNSFSLLR